jgi:hypothetical protein
MGDITVKVMLPLTNKFFYMACTEFIKWPVSILMTLKEKLSHYCHADYMVERNYSSYSFLTSALEGGER